MKFSNILIGLLVVSAVMFNLVLLVNGLYVWGIEDVSYMSLVSLSQVSLEKLINHPLSLFDSLSLGLVKGFLVFGNICLGVLCIGMGLFVLKGTRNVAIKLISFIRS